MVRSNESKIRKLIEDEVQFRIRFLKDLMDFGCHPGTQDRSQIGPNRDQKTKHIF